MDPNVKTVLVQLKTEQNEPIGVPLDVPADIAVERLQLICDKLNNDDGSSKETEQVPYLFFLNDDDRTEIRRTLAEAICSLPASGTLELEKCIDIICAPQSVFRVETVTRCTASLDGHTDAIVSVSFRPDGTGLATGSGDTTVRFWDITTETPLRTGSGHRSWVLAIAWSPDGSRLASGDRDGLIYIWDAGTNENTGHCLRGHKQWINGLAWEPFHCNAECRRLVSASKDCTARIWDATLKQTVFILSGHTQSVSSVKWGGSGLIYTASQDRTIKVWCGHRGILCRTLEGHGHWVNTLALSTEYIIRLGRYDPKTRSPMATPETVQTRYEEIHQNGERLVSGSDDFTLFMWRPETEKKPLCRMTGHQQLINDVKFSPDGRLVASASFDRSIKLWDGHSGKFRCTFRGHVKAVYQVAWSADNRLLVSASADSTVKVWNVRSGQLALDLPGHRDEVYALDWSPDGQRVASGGKDRTLKLWRK